MGATRVTGAQHWVRFVKEASKYQIVNEYVPGATCDPLSSFWIHAWVKLSPGASGTRIVGQAELKTRGPLQLLPRVTSRNTQPLGSTTVWFDSFFSVTCTTWPGSARAGETRTLTPGSPQVVSPTRRGV
jgi:hypothetical protein